MKYIYIYFFNFQVLAEVYPQHPFDIAVFGDHFFWTDWMLHAVLRADKYTGENVAWLRKDIKRPMGIVAISNNTNECIITSNNLLYFIT